jgi:hypothetical protein
MPKGPGSEVGCNRMPLERGKRTPRSVPEKAEHSNLTKRGTRAVQFLIARLDPADLKRVDQDSKIIRRIHDGDDESGEYPAIWRTGVH